MAKWIQNGPPYSLYYIDLRSANKKFYINKEKLIKIFSHQNGLLSSLPYLGKYIMAVVASALADHLRKTGKLTTTSARKLFTAFAVATPGLMMILQIFYGYDRVWSVAIFTIALTLNGAVTAGYLGNGLDIAPNFSGTIFGMANTLSSFGGFLSSFMVGTLTNNNVRLYFSLFILIK